MENKNFEFNENFKPASFVEGEIYRNNDPYFEELSRQLLSKIFPAIDPYSGNYPEINQDLKYTPIVFENCYGEDKDGNPIYFNKLQNDINGK